MLSAHQDLKTLKVVPLTDGEVDAGMEPSPARDRRLEVDRRSL